MYEGVGVEDVRIKLRREELFRSIIRACISVQYWRSRPSAAQSVQCWPSLGLQYVHTRTYCVMFVLSSRCVPVAVSVCSCREHWPSSMRAHLPIWTLHVRNITSVDPLLFAAALVFIQLNTAVEYPVKVKKLIFFVSFLLENYIN